ncbi:hypothetical protein BFC17_21275 [Alteromonas lipolytica]|uniref:DUF218 domain-containing protein n=1 Tax=Alteromonas lipolytica TaxID=1856405 RepID=A0A1E8FED6_9ALTE|nr:hypothetical protein BFC17_21275 [Alteromonas lipolytica]
MAIILAILSSQPYFSDLLLYPLEYGTEQTDSPLTINSSPDYILALACNYDSESDRLPEVSKFPECSMQRLTQAVITHMETNAPIIVTGGNFLSDPEIVYAHKAKQFLVSLGVEETSIITISKGYDTLTEMRAVKHLVPNKDISIISSASHRLRVKAIANSLDLTINFIPVDYLSGGELTPYLSWPNANAFLAFQRAIYEYLAIVKYAVSKNHSLALS